MSREKQIEEMIEIVKPFVSGLACGDESGSCELTDCRSCKARNLVNKLLEADCGNQSEKYLVKENGDIEPLNKQSEKMVEVVRCCDCKYCEVVINDIISEPKYFCTRLIGCFPVDPTDYCSRAVKKGGE